MRTEDISRFKGKFKTAIQKWGNAKIDEIFPNKPQMKAFAKNGLNNVLSRADDKLNKWIDTFMLFAANDTGTIDSDQIIEMMADMFKELEPHRYQFEFLDVEIGKGEVAFHLPQSMLFDLILGKSGTIRMTADDILELKDFLNE